MHPGFRIARVFGPGLLVVDDRSGFAAGIPRAQLLPIAPVRRELPLDIWFRIDGLPIKLGFCWFPTNTAGAPNELVEDVANQVWITRSPFASPDVGHAMPDQRARWNVEAAASVIFPAPGPPKLPGMPSRCSRSARPSFRR